MNSGSDQSGARTARPALGGIADAACGSGEKAEAMHPDPTAQTFTAWASIAAGEIRYTDRGSGPTLVFLHGVLMDGSVWDRVVDRLSSRYRCVVPTLPLGAHTRPMRPDADLTLAGFGSIVHDLLDALALQDVTLIGNDHAAVLAAAVQPSDRLSRLVISSCEAFENFPPGLPGKNLRATAAIPGGLATIGALLRARALRRLPVAFGWLTKRRLPDRLVDRWLAPLQSDPEVRRDLRRYLLESRRSQMIDICRQLSSVDLPTLVIWTPEDRIQRPDHGRRLAALIRGSRLEQVRDSYTLIMQDQPERLAALIDDFAGAGRPERPTRISNPHSSPLAGAAQEHPMTTPTKIPSGAATRRVAAVVATAAAAGLAVAHLSVTLSRFPAGGGLWRLLGLVVMPAVLAALLAVAAGSTLRAGRPPRAVHVGIVVGAVVLWVMALAMLFVTIQSGSPAIVMPNGPGLWSIVGAPAFTVLATRIRGAYPATGTGRDAA